MKSDFDVAVIGGGTAGLVTASGCARLGRRVALIERHALGGDCLWTGCVPTKALVATAKLIDQAAHADRYGLEPHRFSITPGRIMDSMRAARAVVEKNDDPARFRALGIDVIEGSARLAGPQEIEIGDRKIRAKDVVIATGSRTAVPPIPGLAEAGFLDHVSFLAQDELPASIVVLGGGYIGIEFAQIFRRLGSEVTVIEMTEQIIPKEDADVIRLIRAQLEAEGISIRTAFTAKGVRKDRTRKVLSIEGRDGVKDEVVADEIFVAAGRRGNTEGLGLEAIGVEMNRSYIAVDPYLQTNVPHLWAIGDVHGGLQFTHVASFEAMKLVRNLLFPGKSRIDYDNVPWALYTDPEVAHIGMTETEAVEQVGEKNVRVYRAGMEDVDRAVVDRATAGFVKIVADRKGKILGAHVVGSNASTLIQQFVLARAHGVKVGDLARLVSPYPSLADAVGKAASGYWQNAASGWLGRAANKIAAWSQ
jgi:pyruvate/2-oxoglutarate dehydrogenase complex dihydrolipoamide dehydrogenase (E3) component